MLGKDHVNISLAFILTFIIPLLFVGNIDFIYPFILLVAVLIGSLLPDVDCGGKSALFYKFPEIHQITNFVAKKTIIPLFKHLVTKKKIKTQYDVKDEHRGIIHSPIGVLFSSFILSILILVLSLVLGAFNWKVILIIFIGLLIGQLLHLFQDSCTVSGINWGFPFNTRDLKGSIRTFNRKDKRPFYFASMFYFLIVLIFLGYSFNFLNNLSLFLVYLIIIIYNILALFLIRLLSK